MPWHDVSFYVSLAILIFNEKSSDGNTVNAVQNGMTSQYNESRENYIRKLLFKHI